MIGEALWLLLLVFPALAAVWLIALGGLVRRAARLRWTGAEVSATPA
jgi:hypothetical protein